MPEKLGNGGHGPENYDPNTGKYETDGQPNKSYDNPEENILGSLGIEEELDNSLERAIKDCYFKETYKKNIKEMIQSLPESEYKDVLINYIKKSGKNTINIGIFPIDGYNNVTKTVELDYSTIEKKDLKTFTHEFGHAISDFYKGNKVFLLSVSFENENGNTIHEELISDWEKNKDVILSDYEKVETPILKEAFAQKGLKYLTEKEQKENFEKEKEEKLIYLQNEIDKLINQFRSYSKGKTNEELMKDEFALNLDKKYGQISQEKSKLEKKEFVPKEITEEEFNLKMEALRENIFPKYMNLSDAVSSMTNSSHGLCGAGHSNGYWNSENIPDEFFASCFESLVTNNKDEIELYEKYFPNAFKTAKDSILQIYDKIKGEDLYGKLGI